ncbi:MAG: DUF4115 domain-containing protein [Elusimicrobia bacterium]|nr:DUF4115 domain-containing protein [Elusimicrobiota bacterium]
MPDRDPLRRIPPKTVPAAIDVDVGSVLKAARLKKGQSVDVISQHTRVPKKLIEALEANHLDEFPAMVYLRGFLKIYCDHLDVEFEPLWKKVNPDQPAPALPGAGPGKAEAPAAPGPRLPNPLPAVLLAAGGLIAWLILRSPAPAIQGPEASPAPPPVLQPISAPMEPVVTLAFKEDVWVRVTVDDKIRFEGIAPRGGKPQEYKPKTAVSIRTPSPDDIILSLNGAATGFPAAGPSGEYALPVR